MRNLNETQRVIVDQFEQEPFYNREILSSLTFDNQATGIVGARGIGKTTFLLKQALASGLRQGKAFYVLADSLYFLENTLINLVDTLYKETEVRLLCIDEVHKYPNWNQELKNISDIYRDFRVLFTGSSAIDLIKSKYDLSRRVTLHHLHGLSFREYLEFYLDVKIPKISFEDLINHHVIFANDLKIPEVIRQFKNYLSAGYYPFFKNFSQDREKFQAIENSTQKTIYEDIATLHALKTPTLMIIEKLFKYVISSPPGELSAYKLANTLNKDFDSISEYLNYLEQASLIRFLFSNKSGKAALRNPNKMFPENTNLMFASYLPQTQDSVIGKVRETFVINQFQNAGINVFYSEIGDIEANNIIFEIGGKNKTLKQIKGLENGYILADDILVGNQRTIPLYLAGLLY